jgi:predicted nuclease of restriction endonuclease-like RecB superfamily
MLSIEHVRFARRKGELVRTPLWGLSVTQAEELVAELQALAVEHHHKTRGELVAAFGDVVAAESVQRALRGAQKLVLDQCDFALREDIDPPALRDALYRRAAAVRLSDEAFNRDVIVGEVAAEHELDADAFEALLYADLDEARLVDATPLRTMTPTELVARWELAEVQALLLRAERITIDVDARPAELRALLRSMKLFQLLFEVEASTGGEGGAAGGTGVRFVIDGPVSLFSQSLRYGLKLALLVPKIVACRVYRLQADVQTKKGVVAARFVLAGRGPAVGNTVDDNGVSNVDDDVPPLVAGLLKGLPEHLTGPLQGAKVALSNEVLSVPGVGACVPDVVVTATDGRRVFVEVLGFWSRDAVWRRVALVERGLPVPVVLCVSERLRVSEAALDDANAGSGAGSGGALVTFKGTLSAKKVADRMVALLGPPPVARPTGKAKA